MVRPPRTLFFATAGDLISNGNTSLLRVLFFWTILCGKFLNVYFIISPPPPGNVSIAANLTHYYCLEAQTIFIVFSEKWLCHSQQQREI